LVLNYAENESAGAPLVLLHGLTSKSAHMVTPLAALQDRWHVYAPDLRGHGKSGRAADNSYDVGSYARDIIAFLKGVVKAPAVVIGHSLGALTTIGTAAGYNEGVKAAVLLDPPLYTGIDMDVLNSDPKTKQYFQMVYDLKSSSPSYETILETARQAMQGADEEEIRDWADTIAGVAPGTVQAVLEKRFWGDMDLDEALDKIMCPVLMIHGDWANGAAVRESDVAYFRGHLPNAQIIHMPETDHGLKMQQEPELVVGYVRAFLQSQGIEG
jgi:pimeloyl-ACP methyl ester carboxylesterase